MLCIKLGKRTSGRNIRIQRLYHTVQHCKCFRPTIRASDQRLTVTTRECWMINRGPGFLAVVIWPFSRPLLTPSPSRQQVVSLSQSSCVSSDELTDGRGGGGVSGEEPNHTTARKSGPLYIIQYSLLTIRGDRREMAEFVHDTWVSQ